MQRNHSTRHHHHPSYLSSSSSSSYNENPRIPITRPKTSILLPRTTITTYQRLLSLPPSSSSSPSIPPALLKKPFRSPLIPTFLHSTPIFRYLLERSRDKLPPTERCDLCPLHARWLEAPLVHLMALVGYELHTHLQSLMTDLHPARRSPATNAVLRALYPWQAARFCEPGTKVVGCLACQLGKLYGDGEALEALSVVARSGRRGAAGIVQLVDEGWVGSWGSRSVDVREVRADRRKARGDDNDNLNAEWRGGRFRSARGEVQWREKKGFVLSRGTERGRSKGRGERPAPSRGHSVRNEKPVDVAPPVRPHRPQGLTLSILGKQEDRIRWAWRSNEDDQTIKRKAVPVPDTEEDWVKWARISNDEDRTIKRKRLPVPNDEDKEE
ncbi:MAG: hypothetical protein LQ349_009180, partial [Xanthoria aureola]